MALDRFGRNIHYLRISLTDHCNLRCIYCMPEDMTFRPNAEMMQDDEVLLLTRLFADLGFDKIPPDRWGTDRADERGRYCQRHCRHAGHPFHIDDHQWCPALQAGQTAG